MPMLTSTFRPETLLKSNSNWAGAKNTQCQIRPQKKCKYVQSYKIPLNPITNPNLRREKKRSRRYMGRQPVCCTQCSWKWPWWTADQCYMWVCSNHDTLLNPARSEAGLARYMHSAWMYIKSLPYWNLHRSPFEQMVSIKSSFLSW